MAIAVPMVPGPALARPSSYLAVPGGTLEITQSGARILLTLGRANRTWQTRLPADHDTLISPGTFQGAQKLGTVGRSVVVLTTTHASQTGSGGPRARCAAGQEVILRVIRLTPTLRQTFTLPLESCWTGVYRMPPGWNAATATLRTGDGVGGVDTAIRPYCVNADGTVTRRPPRR